MQSHHACICLYFLIWYQLKKLVDNDAGGETYWHLINWSIKQSKQLFAGKVTLFSSNINEGLKAVLFFKRKDFTRTESTTTHITEQKQKRQF